MAKNNYRCRKRTKSSNWFRTSLSKRIKRQSQAEKKHILKRKRRRILQQIKYKAFIEKSNWEIEHMGMGLE